MNWLDNQSDATYVLLARIVLGGLWWSVITLLALGPNNDAVEWHWAYWRILTAAFLTLYYCKYARLIIHASMKARRARLTEERRRT